MNKLSSALATALAFSAASGAFAATINLSTSDTLGQSSFNAGTRWAGGAAPSAGNDYVVGSGLRLRTPASAFTGTFAGDSLTIANGFSTGSMNGGATLDLNGLTYKGTGSTGVITVNNLILAGGSINHLNAATDVFNLAGNMSVTGDSIIRSKQGATTVSASISGSADLYIGATDAVPANSNLGFQLTLSGNNSFTGDIITTASTALLTLANTGSLSFSIGANGVNNSVSGTGSFTGNGVFNIDTSGADLTVGNTWNLVSTTTKSFGGTFSVAGYSDVGGGIWSDGMFEFDTASGVLELAAIPEPSTGAILAGGLILAVVAGKRRRRAV